MEEFYEEARRLLVSKGLEEATDGSWRRPIASSGLTAHPQEQKLDRKGGLIVAHNILEAIYELMYEGDADAAKLLRKFRLEECPGGEEK